MEENNEFEELKFGAPLDFDHVHTWVVDEDPDYPDRELVTCKCGVGFIRIKE